MYRPKFFILQELVDPSIYEHWGERAWEWLDRPALVTLDSLRNKFGPITVNNWHAGGLFKESGLRTFKTSTGAQWSMHRYGRAFDPKPKNATPQEVHAYVLAHPDEFPLLTTLEAIEDTPTWVHFDTRNHGKPGIWVVNP